MANLHPSVLLLAACLTAAGCTTSTGTGADVGTVDATVNGDGGTADARSADARSVDAFATSDVGPSCSGDLDCIDEEMCTGGGCVPNSCPGTGGESMGCGVRPECGDAIGILIAQCWQCVDPVTCERID
ncbi:MAG: putative small secreted protein [Polyangiales bacterium]|jgi:predicted small secreted protein